MKYFLVIFISLLLTNFFGATTINNTVLLLPLLLFFILELHKKAIFKIYLITVLIGLFLSMVSCYIFNGQSLFATFKSSAPFLYIIFYFMLKSINLSIPEMENALIVLTIVFCVCYVIQYLIYPMAIFSGGEVAYKDDVRIRLVGQGFSSLGYFFGLNKYLQTKKTSHLMLSILCFVIIFLMGFRTMLVTIALFTFVMIIRINGFNWRFVWYSILVCVVFIGMLQLPVFTNKFDSMLERQGYDVLSNPKYIRVIQFQYYTTRHFKNIWEFIFGSGLPFAQKNGGEVTAYSRYMYNLTARGINWVDWGLLSLSWIIGIPTVLAMIAYSIKAYYLKVVSDYYYLGIWFIYLVASSITTMDFYRSGNFIVQALVLYLVEKVHNDHTLKKTNKQNENWNIDISSCA
jgi:hypothetical protein